MLPSNHVKDLTNQVFGKLTVTKFSHVKKRGNHFITYWECKCCCGKTKIISGSNLKTGNTKSCGHFRFKWKNQRKIKANGFELSKSKQIVRRELAKIFNEHLKNREKVKTNTYVFLPGARFLFERLLANGAPISKCGQKIRFHFYEKEFNIFNSWTEQNKNYNYIVKKFKRKKIHFNSFQTKFKPNSFIYDGGWIDLCAAAIPPIYRLIEETILGNAINIGRGLFAFTVDETGIRIAPDQRVKFNEELINKLNEKVLTETNNNSSIRLIYNKKYINTNSILSRKMRTFAFEIVSKESLNKRVPKIDFPKNSASIRIQQSTNTERKEIMNNNNPVYNDIVKLIKKHSNFSAQELSNMLGGTKFKVPVQIIAGWKRAATVRG